MREREFEAALLWDIVDYLPKDRAEPFIAALARAMKPGGMVYLLSSTSRMEAPGPVHTYFVQSDGRISTRPIDGALAKRIRRENRALIPLFANFENVSLPLLRSGMREILLKRRCHRAARRTTRRRKDARGLLDPGRASVYHVGRFRAGV